MTVASSHSAWLCVAFGMVAKTVEAASNLPQPLVFLSFLGSGFVPTDSMPTGLRWFAEYQPFTPFIDTVRGLLPGTAIGNSATIAVAWCVASPWPATSGPGSCTTATPTPPGSPPSMLLPLRQRHQGGGSQLLMTQAGV
jgi:hypothetical protein